MIDIYSCQPGGPKPCNIKMDTHEMLISTWVYEGMANIKDYLDPISHFNRNIHRFFPSTGLTHGRRYHLGWTDIITDEGFLTSNLEHKKFVTVFDTEHLTTEKSLANIPRNYLSQGRVFTSDLDFHMEIMSSNEKVEIYRSYVSMIEVCSAMGG